jgi:hypothetical protein
MQVNVNMTDKVVAVNGLALPCDFKIDPTLAALRWEGDALYGNMTPAAGQTGGGDFRDPSIIAPYVAAWRTALQTKLDAVTADATSEAAAYQKFLSDEKAAEAKRVAVAAQPAPKSGK